MSEIDASEIIPGVWQGGFLGTSGVRALVPAGFDVVAQTAVEAMIPPSAFPPGITVYSLPLEDIAAPMPRTTLQKIKKLAAVLARHHRDGQKILVTCNLGLNRSGLIVGYLLRELGVRGVDAIDMIRDRRAPAALNNPVFQALVAREA